MTAGIQTPVEAYSLIQFFNELRKAFDRGAYQADYSSSTYTVLPNIQLSSNQDLIQQAERVVEWFKSNKDLLAQISLLHLREKMVLIPPAIPSYFSGVQVLTIEDSLLSSVGSNLCGMRFLKSLYLINNTALRQIDQEIRCFRELERIVVIGSPKLTTLPQETYELPKLQDFRIDGQRYNVNQNVQILPEIEEISSASQNDLESLFPQISNISSDDVEENELDLFHPLESDRFSLQPMDLSDVNLGEELGDLDTYFAKTL